MVDGENCFQGNNAEELKARSPELLQNDQISLKQISNGKATVSNFSFDRMVERVEKAFMENVGLKS